MNTVKAKKTAGFLLFWTLYAPLIPLGLLMMFAEWLAVWLDEHPWLHYYSNKVHDWAEALGYKPKV